MNLYNFTDYTPDNDPNFWVKQTVGFNVVNLLMWCKSTKNSTRCFHWKWEYF